MGASTVTRVGFGDDAAVQVLGALATSYQANSYELLTRNCHTFCNELALQLQVDLMPGWITRCGHPARVLTGR